MRKTHTADNAECNNKKMNRLNERGYNKSDCCNAGAQHSHFSAAHFIVENTH